MADLSKPLRIMKRILILLLALIPVMASAQDFKPLPPIELNDSPANIVNVSERQYMSGGTYYLASHHFAQRGMTASLGVPASFDLFLQPETMVREGTTAKLHIGGDIYYKSVDFVSDKSIYIDIMGLHLQHIAVSGLQAITFLYNGDLIYTLDFGEAEQELWRMTAEALCDEVRRFGILVY